MNRREILVYVLVGGLVICAWSLIRKGIEKFHTTPQYTPLSERRNYVWGDPVSILVNHSPRITDSIPLQNRDAPLRGFGMSPIDTPPLDGVTTEELERIVGEYSLCNSPGLVDNNRAAMYLATL